MPKCVLLVDDSPAVRRSLCIIFESAGIEVCGEAEDGAKAMEKAKHLKPDLIVLDLGMPDRLKATAMARRLPWLRTRGKVSNGWLCSKAIPLGQPSTPSSHPLGVRI